MKVKPGDRIKFIHPYPKSVHPNCIGTVLPARIRPETADHDYGGKLARNEWAVQCDPPCNYLGCWIESALEIYIETDMDKRIKYWRDLK